MASKTNGQQALILVPHPNESAPIRNFAGNVARSLARNGLMVETEYLRKSRDAALKARKLLGRTSRMENDRLDVLFSAYDLAERLDRYFSLPEGAGFCEIHACAGNDRRLRQDDFLPLTKNLYRRRGTLQYPWKEILDALRARMHGGWFSDIARAVGIDVARAIETLRTGIALRTPSIRYNLIEAKCDGFYSAIPKNSDITLAYLPMILSDDTKEIFNLEVSRFEFNYCLISFRGAHLGKKELDAAASLFSDRIKI